MKTYLYSILMATTAVLTTACGGEDKAKYTEYNNNTGAQYAPQMYQSDAYEPYSQVTLNPNNEGGTNIRRPAQGSIPRVSGLVGELPIELMPQYPIARDSFELAGKILKTPVELNKETLAQGKYLYESYCLPCHGEQGAGNGLVAAKYGGVPNYKAGNIVNQPSGHIYHVITMGKNRMYPHGSQILPLDRWKIVHYVNQLRGYKDGQGATTPVAAKTDTTALAIKTN